jgi:hypothetical protein
LLDMYLYIILPDVIFKKSLKIPKG